MTEEEEYYPDPEQNAPAPKAPRRKLTYEEKKEKYLNPTAFHCRELIIHTLSIYPQLSATMLQVGIGPGISPKHWRPVLHDMVKEGVVKLDTKVYLTPSDRNQTYYLYSLRNWEVKTFV